jgi:hypothetical protein
MMDNKLNKTFEKLLTQYLKLIDNNKADFIEYNESHKNHNANDIFDIYWDLEVTSGIGEIEKVRLTRKTPCASLPEKLRELIK